jgi:hypothetical protein
MVITLTEWLEIIFIFSIPYHDYLVHDVFSNLYEASRDDAYLHEIALSGSPFCDGPPLNFQV